MSLVAAHILLHFRKLLWHYGLGVTGKICVNHAYCLVERNLLLSAIIFNSLSADAGMLIGRLESHVLKSYNREKQLSYSSTADLMFSSILHLLVFCRVTPHVILFIDILPVSLDTVCYC